ncbi:uncharacterized protein EDB91DRAFT_290071 [Suillus paluster]|uniref:uncharacterized protein n=1 Tax=Suillus paluster TaxID=48578 RepID=UPI001B8649B8|nr:uncharacterized protein EDB91DRAFT_290071 [Suillus paluster]KAG1742672.1 hypothetical protein EDB91DRAFT_290071 [Suillus paluster]
MMERHDSAIRVMKGKRPILRVLVDTVIRCSAALCSFVICYARGNSGMYIMAGQLSPIISIAFCMVFIRIAANKHTQYLSTVCGGTTETGDETRSKILCSLCTLYSGQNDFWADRDSSEVAIHLSV